MPLAVHGDGGRQGQGGAIGRECVIVAISLAVGDMYRGPTTVDVTLCIRGNANKTPPKSAHHQCSKLWIHPLVKCPLYHIFATSLGFTKLGCSRRARHESNE